MWATFKALRYKEFGLNLSAREVVLPSSLRLTDSVKHSSNTSNIAAYNIVNTRFKVMRIHMACSTITTRLTEVSRTRAI